MPIAEVNGIQIFWELTGTYGEPLVLVHGSWVDHHRWDAVVPQLSQSFRVVTYDRRGHSQSERPASRYSIRDEVADLAALIQELRIAPCHIAGNSSGGSIVVRLAGENPELFRSMVVNEPPLLNLLADDPFGKKMLPAIKARIANVVVLLEAGKMEEGARQFVETIAFGPGAWAQLSSVLKETAIFNASTFLDEMHDPEFLFVDLASLHNFFHPALLTVGELGPPFFPSIAEQLAKALPQAKRKTFLGADHEPEQSSPEAFVETIKEFIATAVRYPQNRSA